MMEGKYCGCRCKNPEGECPCCDERVLSEEWESSPQFRPMTDEDIARVRQAVAEGKVPRRKL